VEAIKGAKEREAAQEIERLNRQLKEYADKLSGTKDEPLGQPSHVGTALAVLLKIEMEKNLTMHVETRRLAMETYEKLLGMWEGRK